MLILICRLQTLMLCTPDLLKEHPDQGLPYVLRAIAAVPLVDFYTPLTMYPGTVIVASREEFVDLSEVRVEFFGRFSNSLQDIILTLAKC